MPATLEQMRALAGKLPAALLLAAALAHVVSQGSAAAVPDDERLAYSVAWSSGLPVGSAELNARNVDPGWRFEMTLRANLPNFEVEDAFLSTADAGMCSEQFQKHVRHGRKRTHEALRFGPETVERRNLEADRGEPPGVSRSGPCERDALAFLYFLREELAAGRIPPPAQVHFGAGYRIELGFVRARWLRLGGDSRLTDEIRARVRGPASDHSFSVFFARDEARTPLLFQVEFEEGVFLMQLAE